MLTSKMPPWVNKLVSGGGPISGLQILCDSMSTSFDLAISLLVCSVGRPRAFYYILSFIYCMAEQFELVFSRVRCLRVAQESARTLKVCLP